MAVVWESIIWEGREAGEGAIFLGGNCPRTLIDILLKLFLKHIKSFISHSLDFLSKCPIGVDEDTEIVTFDVIRLCTSIPHEFGLVAIDYFLTKAIVT